MVNIIKNLMGVNILIFIFAWIPAYTSKDQALLFDITGFLLLTSNIIICMLAFMLAKKQNC